jgi:outer membrane PBP1 activator LpoA protein
MINTQQMLMAGLIVCGLAACKPASPPPDIVKTQRDALNKAKAVEGQVQQQAQEQQKTIDEQQK